MEKQYFKLEPSETAVLSVAAQILAAFIVSGQLTDKNEELVTQRSVVMAVKLSRKIENLIQSDNETVSGG